jgi:hypothetical protein
MKVELEIINSTLFWLEYSLKSGKGSWSTAKARVLSLPRKSLPLCKTPSFGVDGPINKTILCFNWVSIQMGRIQICLG